MKIEFDNPKALARPNGFSHVARISGGVTLVVSGQVAYDEGGNVVGVGDLAQQVERVYRNIQIALEANGASMANLVKTTLFVKDLSPDKAVVIRRVRSAFLSEGAPPASTMVGVASLARPELLLEVEAIAVLAP